MKWRLVMMVSPWFLGWWCVRCSPALYRGDCLCQSRSMLILGSSDFRSSSLLVKHRAAPLFGRIAFRLILRLVLAFISISFSVVVSPHFSGCYSPPGLV
jgi:hypothetical protein